jgi:hypothetical protein
MERPVKEVILPISGVKAFVYTYYLRSERKAIEAIMLDSAEFEQDEAGKPKLKKVDASYRTKMEDKAVLLAVKKMVDKEGKDLPLTVETLDNLPDEDFQELQSGLPQRQPKKKLTTTQ